MTLAEFSEGAGVNATQPEFPISNPSRRNTIRQRLVPVNPSSASALTARPGTNASPANLNGCFCYSLLVVPINDESYVYSTQSQDTAHPSLAFRSHFRRGVSFPPRRFFPVLAGMGLHGHLVRSHAGYLGLFPEARSPTGGAPLAHKRKDQPAENHHSMGPVGCLWVLTDPRPGLPFRLVSRPALADDSFPNLGIRRLADHPLGHEGKQFRLSYHPSRRRAESHLHRTLSARPPSHVLRRRSHAAFHAARAWLLVGAAWLPPRHSFDRA